MHEKDLCVYTRLFLDDLDNRFSNSLRCFFPLHRVCFCGNNWRYLIQKYVIYVIKNIMKKYT